jgi:hypothetical protein
VSNVAHGPLVFFFFKVDVSTLLLKILHHIDILHVHVFSSPELLKARCPSDVCLLDLHIFDFLSRTTGPILYEIFHLETRRQRDVISKQFPGVSRKNPNMVNTMCPGVKQAS